MRDARSATVGQYAYAVTGPEGLVGFLHDSHQRTAVELDRDFDAVLARRALLERLAGTPPATAPSTAATAEPRPPPIVLPATPPTTAPAAGPTPVRVPSICTGRTLSTMPIRTFCSRRASSRL